MRISIAGRNHGAGLAGNLVEVEGGRRLCPGEIIAAFEEHARRKAS